MKGGRTDWRGDNSTPVSQRRNPAVPVAVVAGAGIAGLRVRFAGASRNYETVTSMVRAGAPSTSRVTVALPFFRALAPGLNRAEPSV